MTEFNLRNALFGLHPIYISNTITFHCGYEKNYFSYMCIKHPVTAYAVECGSQLKFK